MKGDKHDVSSAAGVNENEMHVLSIVEKLRNEGSIASFSDLSARIRMTEAQLEFTLLELLRKQYVIKTSELESGGYVRIGYSVTRKGNETLEDYADKAHNFVKTIVDLEISKDERNKVIEHIVANRDLLWFAYYNGLITRGQVEDIARKLNTRVANIWWPYDYLSVLPPH